MMNSSDRDTEEPLVELLSEELSELSVLSELSELESEELESVELCG